MDEFYGEIHRVNRFEFYDFMLMGTARHFDLDVASGRAKSNKSLGKFFLNLNGRVEPDVTYEIGASNARFSVNIKKHLPKIRAIAFEASPYNYELHKNNVDIMQNKVEYLHFAVSNHTGEAEFLIQRKLQGEAVDVIRDNNSLLARTEDGVEYESIRVPTITLEEFANRNGLLEKNFTALIDVEGATESVLVGAGDLWKHCSALMIEVEQHAYW